MRIAIDIDYDGVMTKGIYDKVVQDAVEEIRGASGYVNDRPWRVDRVMIQPTTVVWQGR